MEYRNEYDRNNRCYNKGLCAFVFIDVVLLTLIIAACYMESEEQRDISLSTDTDICVFCKDIRIHPDDDIGGFVRKGKNNEICCMADRTTLDVLFGYFVDHWMKKKLAKDDRHFTRYKCEVDSGAEKRKPSIKFVGRNYKHTGSHDTVMWDSWSDDAILPDSRDIVYDEQHGLIEIKKAGLYQIYTQVVLNHDEITHKSTGKSYIHQHFVIRADAGLGQEKTLLEASKSSCSYRTNNLTVTSYLDGAFRLSKGDKLSVRVKEKAEIVPIAHMNFFGAYML